MLKNGHIYKLVVKLNHLDNMETTRRQSIKNFDENGYDVDMANKRCLNHTTNNSIKQTWNNTNNSNVVGNKFAEPIDEMTSSLKEKTFLPSGSIKALASKQSPILNSNRIYKSNSVSNSKSSSSLTRTKEKLLKQKNVQSTDGTRKKSTQSTATILINKFKLIKLKNRLQKSSSVKFNHVNNKNFNPSSYYLTRVKRNSAINQQVLINEIKYLKNSQIKQNNPHMYPTLGVGTAKKSVTLKDSKFFNGQFSKKKYSTSVPFYKRNHTRKHAGDVSMYNWDRVNEDSVFYFHPEASEPRLTHFPNHNIIDSSDSSKNSDSNVFFSKAKGFNLKKQLNRNYHSNDINENQPFVNANKGDKHLELSYDPICLNDHLFYNSSPNLNELAMPNVFKNKKKFKFDFDEANKHEDKQDSNLNINRQYSSQSIENFKFHNSL